MASVGRYPYTMPVCATAILPPLPSFISGLLSYGLRSLICEVFPAQTYPVRESRNAIASPPMNVVVCMDILVGSPRVMSVGEITVAVSSPANTVSLSCCMMSNRREEDASDASVCPSRTLSLATLRLCNDVTQTVPSSSWTWLCDTELMMIAPITSTVRMPKIATTLTQE